MAGLPPVEVAAQAPASGLMSGLAGGAVSGVLGLVGGLLGNRSSAKQAKAQMDFQERMRATQYQTAVKDLQAAGLNPMLAYTQGGAGTPSGAQAPQSNVLGPAANSAVEAFSSIMETKNKDEMNKSIQLQRVETLEKINLLREQQDVSSAESVRLRKLVEELQVQILQKQQDLERGRQTFAADVAKRKSESALEGFKVPKARNEAAAQESWFMKEVAPYLTSAQQTKDLLPDFIFKRLTRGIKGFNVSEIRK